MTVMHHLSKGSFLERGYTNSHIKNQNGQVNVGGKHNVNIMGKRSHCSADTTADAVKDAINLLKRVRL